MESFTCEVIYSTSKAAADDITIMTFHGDLGFQYLTGSPEDWCKPKVNEEIVSCKKNQESPWQKFTVSDNYPFTWNSELKISSAACSAWRGFKEDTSNIKLKAGLNYQTQSGYKVYDSARDGVVSVAGGPYAMTLEGAWNAFVSVGGVAYALLILAL